MKSFSLFWQITWRHQDDQILEPQAEGAKGFNEILAGLKEGEQALPGLQVIRSETHLIFSDEKLYVIALAGDINQSCLTRVPFDEQRALPEECFDLIAKSLSGESAATTQCVFRCDKDGDHVDCDADLEMFAHDRK